VQQLSFLTVGSTIGSNLSGVVPAFSDSYGEISFSQPVGQTEACTSPANPGSLASSGAAGGFVRYFAQPSPYTGDITGAAYQAAVAFRLRNSNSEPTYQFPVDRGFFTAK
jgi:hypothetical protein